MQNAQRIKQVEQPNAFPELISEDGFITINMKPIVHNLPEDKSAIRKVFTFAGIQSSKSVTYDRATDKLYNNICPDRPKTSGMVIPKSYGKLKIVDPRN